MKLVVLYHPNSEQAGEVQDYARDYMRTRERELGLVSLETKAGAKLAELYGVTQYPAVLALSKEGQLLQLWQGPYLPTTDDLDAYISD